MPLNHTNILVAFANLAKDKQAKIINSATSHNRANQMGESLEEYIKDLFCGSFHLDNGNRLVEHNRHFSYLGNQNNPPDIMLRGGDAVEVKKTESSNASLALNSSHPKDVLHSDDPKIKHECKVCECWNTKDMIYAIGHVRNSEVKRLWFVQGKCWAAKREVYTRLSEAIAKGINTIPDIEFGTTNELARVNKVDPLGITYLRVRGMWGIEHPVNVFNYLPETHDTFANLLLLEEKYNSFPEEDRQALEHLAYNEHLLTIQDVKIKDPNNPANLLDAKVITLR